MEQFGLKGKLKLCQGLEKFMKKEIGFVCVGVVNHKTSLFVMEVTQSSF